jgi:iron complex outermembrane receptor protein
MPDETWAVAASVARSVRFPTAEELYSDGPHLATLSFEVGDDELDEETSLGIDVSLRRRTGRVTGELTLFANQFSDFIYDRFTGEIFDEGKGKEPLPIFQYVQEDAEFVGAETHIDVELAHSEPHHVQLELSGDWVRAELSDRDEPLPRIPPLRLGLSLSYQGARLWAQAAARRVAEQDRVAPDETVTPSHTLYEASVGYRLIAGRSVHDIVLRGTNLSDELAFNHVSRFKELVPLPGRDVSLTYRLLF